MHSPNLTIRDCFRLPRCLWWRSLRVYWRLVWTQRNDPPGKSVLLAASYKTRLTKDPSDMEKAVSKVRGNVPEDQLLCIQGAALFDIGQKDEGLRLMRQAVSLRRSRDTLFSLISRLDRLDGWDEVVDLYPDLVKMNSSHPRVLRWMAVISVHLNNWVEGYTIYRQYTRAFPEDPMAYYWLGISLLEKGQWVSAIKEFKKALSYRYPEEDHPWVGIARCHLFLKNYDESRRAIKEALKYNPNAEDAKELLEEIDNTR